MKATGLVADLEPWWSPRAAALYTMDRQFLVEITSAPLLLLTSASLLVYRTGTPSGETAQVAKRLIGIAFG